MQENPDDVEKEEERRRRRRGEEWRVLAEMLDKLMSIFAAYLEVLFALPPPPISPPSLSPPLVFIQCSLILPMSCLRTPLGYDIFCVFSFSSPLFFFNFFMFCPRFSHFPLFFITILFFPNTYHTLYHLPNCAIASHACLTCPCISFNTPRTSLPTAFTSFYGDSLSSPSSLDDFPHYPRVITILIYTLNLQTQIHFITIGPDSIILSTIPTVFPT